MSGLRAERPIEIRVAMAEAVKAGIVFFRTASDGILTSDVVPPQYIISVDDTAKKVNLYRRHQEVAQSAASSGGEVGVQELVETFQPRHQNGLVPSLRPPQLARPLQQHFSQER